VQLPFLEEIRNRKEILVRRKFNFQPRGLFFGL